jgi:hypothetical protein
LLRGTGLFRSFLQAGFECSTHLNRVGRRLDLLASTKHDCYVREDYDRLLAHGIRTARVAACWHKIEKSPGSYDFSSLAVFLDAADEKGVELVLDILHFGWPDFLDIFSNDFPRQFGQFVRAFVRFLKGRDNVPRFIAPVNEVSYLCWAGGEVGCIGPFATGRGKELKYNLIRAGVAGSEILLNELPGVRLISPEPVIHNIGDPSVPGDEAEAHDYTNAMYEAWDMLSGRMNPELGGRPEYLDLIGINFYERNQWIHNSKPITREHPRWRPFSHMLADVWARYRRPMFIAETGTEDDRRAGWLHYVCDEVRRALEAGVPVNGICLYPILNHPGWDDDRHCCNGLFDYADENGVREVHQPLADAIQYENGRFANFFRRINERTAQNGSHLPVTSQMGIRFPTASTSDEPVCTPAESFLP